MKRDCVNFGEIEVEGKRYTMMCDRRRQSAKRKKGPSKQFAKVRTHRFRSAKKFRGGKQLIVGTGAHGALPVMDES